MRFIHGTLPVLFRTALAVAGTTSVYHIGNSWTDQAYGMHDIAKAGGTPTTWGRHMIPGAPLEWIWDHPDQGFRKPCGYATCLPERAWDVVVMQPWDRNLSNDIEHASKFASLALQGNSDVALLILACGPRKAQADPHGAITSDLYFWSARYSVDEAFAEVVWDLSRPVVRHDPYCNVKVGATGTGDGSQDTSQSSEDNSPPKASIEADNTMGDAPLTVTFYANASTDPDSGDAVWGYGWDFGDGNTAGSIVTIQHTYTDNLRARPGRNVAGMTNVEAY